MPKKIAIIALAIIALIVVAGAATYIAKQRQEGAEKVRQEEQVATLPEEPEIDISDWKTYRNEKYGFEVRYPSTWSIEFQTSDEVLFRREESSGIDDVLSISIVEEKRDIMTFVTTGWQEAENFIGAKDCRVIKTISGVMGAGCNWIFGDEEIVSVVVFDTDPPGPKKIMFYPAEALFEYPEPDKIVDMVAKTLKYVK